MSTNDKLDQIVAQARQAREQRDQGYREQALRMYPHICARCCREFSRETLHELTVHHRDHDHDHNPADGSNWELLCIYCHDNEHQRLLEAGRGHADSGRSAGNSARHNPFTALKDMIGKKPADE